MTTNYISSINNTSKVNQKQVKIEKKFTFFGAVNWEGTGPEESSHHNEYLRIWAVQDSKLEVSGLENLQNCANFLKINLKETEIPMSFSDEEPPS